MVIKMKQQSVFRDRIKPLDIARSVSYWQELAKKSDREKLASDYERLLQDHEAISYYWGPMTYEADS